MSDRSRSNAGANRLRSVSSFILRVALFFAVGTFPCFSSSSGVGLATESEVPCEQSESAEKIVVIVQSRLRGCGVRVDCRMPSRVRPDRDLSMTSTLVVPVGHRLPNNLLAPLRC